MSNGERRLKLSYQRAPGGAQYAIDFAVDDTWSSATINIVAGGAWPQGSSEPGRLIRTLEWKISGRFEPGIIPAAELRANCSRKSTAPSRSTHPNSARRVKVLQAQTKTRSDGHFRIGFQH